METAVEAAASKIEMEAVTTEGHVVTKEGADEAPAVKREVTHAAEAAVAAIIGTIATNSAVLENMMSAVVEITVTPGLSPLEGKTVEIGEKKAEDAEPSPRAL